MRACWSRPRTTGNWPTPSQASPGPGRRRAMNLRTKTPRMPAGLGSTRSVARGSPLEPSFRSVFLTIDVVLLLGEAVQELGEPIGYRLVCHLLVEGPQLPADRVRNHRIHRLAIGSPAVPRSCFGLCHVCLLCFLFRHSTLAVACAVRPAARHPPQGTRRYSPMAGIPTWLVSTFP